MIEVTGYICSFCKSSGRVKRVYANAKTCKRHEDACYKNPATKSCFTCSSWENKLCKDGHDKVDMGLCNTICYDPYPQTDCDYWSAKELDEHL